MMSASVHPKASKKDVRHKEQPERVIAYQRAPFSNSLEEHEGSDSDEAPGVGYERIGVIHLVHCWTMEGHPVCPRS